ncbi:MAG: hypothetical protein XD82_0444 [Methanoculleus marisnigri]|uniref:Uncharacterized protein n=1 Tax=Methanoculleus marisnigri TaxID=2198 RepID=A0A124FST2_9EURY|nr:MAG: hypothetical protein XD82_0444 [Methanoculleus marisnigri]
MPGETFPERPHSLHPLALDQGSPDLNPVRTTTDRLICDLYRTIELEEIERHLESRRCHTVQYGEGSIYLVPDRGNLYAMGCLR